MDPNKTLESILSLTSKDPGLLSQDDIEELIEAVSALDEWLSMGGAKPARWTRNDWIFWTKNNEGRGI